MFMLIKYFNTLKYLKPIQFLFRVKLLFKIKGKKRFDLRYKINDNLIFKSSIINYTSFLGENKFKFLNITYDFGDKINWNLDQHGKLWCYNLCYFDYLNQKVIDKKECIYLVDDFIQNYEEITHGRDPYPTSLRIINLIKFIIKNNYYNKKHLDFVYSETVYLSNNLEYHLLANHLLENSFALWFSAHLFDDLNLQNKSSTLIIDQLNEQIADDGAHYELCPMYHQILLVRLSESISLAKFNPIINNNDVLNNLILKAGLMLGWLSEISFNFNYFIRINDSVEGISPSLDDIKNLSESLKINYIKLNLSSSGLRVLRSNSFFCLVDISEITPNYQPGHSHADTFNFILYKNNQPIIVDPGISTYENNNIRHRERSSEYHNTVSINEIDNNEVWGSFRVGKRAKVNVLIDKQNAISASHNGYRSLNIIHYRHWKLNGDELKITDYVSNSYSNRVISSLHFYPNLNLNLSGNYVIVEDLIKITFVGAIKINAELYDYALGFNRTTIASKLVIHFKNKLETIITDV